MKRLLLLAVCCFGLLAAPAAADPTVYFRGKKLTLRHYVYGEVTSATRMIGSVNLGYAHGLEDDQEIGVIRSIEGQYVPIGVLRMNSVQAGESRGIYEGELPLRNTDLVIIAARKLNLWTGRTRIDQTVIRTMISDRTRGYDTGSVSPRLVRELGKDDDLIHRLPLALHVNLDEFDSRRPSWRLPSSVAHSSRRRHPPKRRTPPRRRTESWLPMNRRSTWKSLSCASSGPTLRE